MIKKTYITVAAFVFAVGAAYGQEDLTRRVDVSKDYAPRVEKASKLAIQPQISDTTTLRPDFDYTVRPRAWSGGFDIAPIRAAQMNVGTYNFQYPLYIKVGGGFPGQTILDIYATSTRSGASGLGFYLNHRAQLADIANYYGIKQSAKSTTNSIGAFGKATFGKRGRLSIAGELGFDFDAWSDHGVLKFNVLSNYEAYKHLLDYPGVPVDYISKQHFATPHASIVFGNDFTNLSFWNFRLGGDMYVMNDNLENIEIGGRAFAEIGRQFNLHRLIFGAGIDSYDVWNGGGMIDSNIDGGSSSTYTGNYVMSIHADYTLVHEKIFFGMGARFAFENYLGDDTPANKIWFLPQMELKIAAVDEFNPYVRITSDIENNSYRNTIARNPFQFIRNIDPLPAKVTYEARVGFNGALGGVFYYDIYAGGDIVRNDILFMAMLNSTIIEHVNSLYTDEKRKSLFAGAELQAKIGNGFAVTAAGRYNKYITDMYYRPIYMYDKINYLPKFTASLGMSYHHDKWHLRAGLEVRGAYRFLTDTPSYHANTLFAFMHGQYSFTDFIYFIRWEAPAAVNITIGADYFLSERLGVFLEGNNLANQKLYPYPFYQGVGVNVSAGVKLRF